MSKHYGVGTYRVIRIADHAILVIAEGFAPNLTTKVSIEQLPWRIFPPQFALFFDEPPIGLPALKPFVVSAVFAYPKDRDSVTIIDAAGAHEIKIGGEINWLQMEAQADEGQFIVYRQIGRSNCLIVPHDRIVPAIFARAFGPASQADCKAWAAQHCDK